MIVWPNAWWWVTAVAVGSFLVIAFIITR